MTMEGERREPIHQTVEKWEYGERDHRDVEVVLENCPGLSESLSELLKEGKRRVKFRLEFQDAEANPASREMFGEQVHRVLMEILKKEGRRDGVMQVLISRSGEPAAYADDWHNDGHDIYLYSNREPTQLVLDEKYNENISPSGRLRHGTVNEADIITPEDDSLIRIKGKVLHRRPPKAVLDSERFVLRCWFGKA